MKITDKGKAVIESGLSLRQAHEIETGCSQRRPCRDCDEEMRRLWYGDAYSDEGDE
ncbi:hypothetical protein [Mycobacterium aquaticum]|uniref:hypothetical protein n=1 Tax=Mycobacterium aquaticum TaxID=1927124 RepID=UPI001301E9DB|nr:hypothetical protein [Mycobacterium aquaticum]